MTIGINNFQNQNIQQQSSNIVSSNSSQISTSSFNVVSNTGISLPSGFDSLKSVLSKNLSTLNSISQIVTKNQLTPDVLGNVINKSRLKKFADTNLFEGLIEGLTDLDEEVEGTIAVVNADDNIKYLSFSVESSFVNDNLKNILTNNSKEDIEIEFPRLISHELNKSVHKSIFSTNECSILPEDIYRIKSSYYENTQIAFANNYFLSGENQKKYRKRYYENLKTINDLLNKTYKNIFLINEAKVKTKRKLNFGNTITDFFLVESKSSSLGKISSIILNNESVGFANIFSNKNDTNSDIENFTLNNNISTFNRLQGSKNKIFDIIFSTTGSESSFLKNAKEENFAVNTDRLVGQVITNLSLSMNGFHKDSLSYEFYKSKVQSSVNIESIKLVDSNLYHDIPIIKIDSILSNETSSDLLFNPINNDNAYTYDNNFFDFSSFSGTSLDNKNKFENSQNRDFYINNKTFNIYKQNLFLENELNYNSLILNGSSLKNTLESVNVTKNQKNYTDFHFNPYNFNILRFKSQKSSGFIFNIAYLDIMPRNRDFTTYKLRLQEISSEGLGFNDAKAILNSTSFTYFLKSNPNNKTMTMSNEFANRFDFICTESVSYLRSGGKTSRISLRHFVNPISNTQTFINPMILEYKRPDIKYSLNNDDRSITHGNNLDNEDLDYKSYVEESLNLITPNDVKNENNISPSGVINHILKDLKNQQNKLLNRFKGKKNKLGFMLLENTLNPVPLEKMADKFVKYDSSLTTIDEYIPNRIVMLSSSKFKQIDSNSKRSMLESPIQKNKYTSFKKDSWPKISFDIRNSIFKLKELKSNKSGNDQIISFLNGFKSKAKKVSKITGKTPYLSLLYSDITKYSLDKYEESPFIESIEGKNYKKFDYSTSSNNIKDTMELKIDQASSPTFEISSEQTKAFLSDFYPNSIFKSSSLYFEYVKDVARKAIPENLSNKRSLGYDKLMSDVLLYDKNIDVASILAISSIIKYKNIDIDSDYSLINEKTDGLYEKYINALFSVENVKRQKSYTLRTVDFPSGDNSYITRNNTKKVQYNPANINFSRTEEKNTDDNPNNQPKFNIKIEDHEFDFGIVPGETYTYTFPFLTSYYKISSNNVCSCYRVNESSYMITDFENFKKKHQAAVKDNDDIKRARREDVRDENYQTNLDGLYDYVYSKFYNYDVYLNAEPGSVMYDFEENKAKLYNCLRTQKKTVDNKSVVFNNNLTLRKMIERVTYTDDADIAKSYDDIYKNLNYISYGLSMSEYAIGDISHQPYLKSNLNDLFINILMYVLPDFDQTMNNLSDFDLIVEFINNNKDIVDIFLNLLQPLCNLYSTIFDEIIELSVKSNIYDKLSLSNEGNFPEKKDNQNKDMWNREIALFFKNNLSSLSDKDFMFEKEILKENNTKFDETLYTQLFADLQMISRTLNNSDICEIMSMDIMYSYVSEFERSQSSNIDILNVLNSLSNLENDLAIENPNNLLSNITRLNLISKIMNDYFYYQQKQYDDHCLTFQNNLNINLRDHFVNIINNQDVSFCKNLLDIEKNKSILAEQGMMLLNHTYNRYDIMRFGIKQNFASFLSDKKILKFKFAIISHKNPDIYIPPIYKFYTPILTDITPSHVSLMKDQGKEEDGVFIDNYIGLYNNSSDIKQIYTVEHRAKAAEYILNYLLNKVNKERISEGSSYIIDNQGFEGVKTAFDIVSSAVFSSAVKYTNYRTQKNIDEISLNEIYDDKIGSISYLSAMSKEEFESTFSQNYENIEGALDIENIDMLSSEIIKRKINAVDFISDINKFTNDNVISNALADNNYYDIFSVVIGRKDIERVMLDYYDVNDIKDIVGSESVDKFLDSFSYMVEVEVIWKK